jgi:hypothetical protein
MSRKVGQGPGTDAIQIVRLGQPAFTLETEADGIITDRGAFSRK